MIEFKVSLEEIEQMDREDLAEAEEMWFDDNEHDAHVQAWITHLLLTEQL